ncbi:MAG: hypothetical protein QNJ67_17805 [Kiloniellales bacterium]|nr:hypothetical protein [Kiloniellales bacterium]
MLGRRRNTNAADSEDITDRIRRRTAGLEPSGEERGAVPRKARGPVRDTLDWRLIYKVLDEVSLRLDKALLDKGVQQSFAPTRISLLLDEALETLGVTLTSRARGALFGRVLRELCGPGSQVAASGAVAFKSAAETKATAPRESAEEGPSFGALVAAGRLSPDMARFLELCVPHRLNLLIAGAPGTGRKALLGAMARNIDVRERVATVEWGDPIALDQVRVHRLKAEIKDLSGPKRSTMVEHLWRALSLNPSYLLVDQFPDELQNRRIDGVLQALERDRGGVMALAAQGDLPAILERLGDFRAPDGKAPGFDLVIQTAALPKGGTCVARISELVTGPGKEAQLRDLFRHASAGWPMEDAEGFIGTGRVPAFVENLGDGGAGLRATLDPTEPTT